MTAMGSQAASRALGPNRCDLPLAFTFEVVVVQALNLHRPTNSNANSKLDHELRQTATVDEDYPLLQTSRIVSGVLAEGRSRDKDTLRSAEPDQATNKALNSRATDR